MKVHSDPNAKTQTLDAKGDAKSAFGAAAKTYKAEYFSDYGYHAQMEPLNAVARFNAAGDHVEVWEGTQDPGSSRAAHLAAAPLFRAHAWWVRRHKFARVLALRPPVQAV